MTLTEVHHTKGESVYYTSDVEGLMGVCYSRNDLQGTEVASLVVPAKTRLGSCDVSVHASPSGGAVFVDRGDVGLLAKLTPSQISELAGLEHERLKELLFKGREIAAEVAATG